MIQLRPFQKIAVNQVHAALGSVDRTICTMPTGCHPAGQGILMYDGSIMAVEDVAVGDLLMGPDSCPKTVLGLARGSGPIYEISPIKGDSFCVNEDHILTLVKGRYNAKKQWQKGESLVDVSVREYLTWSRWKKHTHKLIRTGVEFPVKHRPALDIDPYFLGLLLGDGHLGASVSVTTADPEVAAEVDRQADTWSLTPRTSNHKSKGKSQTIGLTALPRGRRNPLLQTLKSLGLQHARSGTKFIPQQYKTAGLSARLHLLAGLIDSDGHHHKACYDYISKSQALSNDVAFVARSCGLAAYIQPTEKRSQDGAGGTYYRVSISGPTYLIPCRVDRKRAPLRRQAKDARRTAFAIRKVCEQDHYFGFTLDGDGRYLLDDFTITHNSGKRYLAVWWAIKAAEKGSRVLIVTHRQILVHQMARECQREKVRHGILMGSEPRFDEAGCQVASVQTLRRRQWRDLPRADLVICDESHMELPAYIEMFKHYPGVKTIGLTATPVGPGGSSLVTHGLYDSLVVPVTDSQLIDDEWLLPCEVWAPWEPDITGVSVGKDEFNQEELADRVEQCTVFANVFQWWAKYSDMQTVAFVPRVKFARGFAEQLEREMGVRSAVISACTRPREREALFEDFEKGEVRVLVSVDVLREGWDATNCQCAIDLQPNNQIRTFRQKTGRIKRPHPGQDHCVLLDFAGNYWRHLHPDEDVPWEEVGVEGASAADVVARKNGRQCPECGSDNIYKGQCQQCGCRLNQNDPWTCGACGYSPAYWERIQEGKCPSCGAPIQRSVRRILMGDGRMKTIPMVKEKKPKTQKDKDVDVWFSCLMQAHYSGRPMGFARWLFQKKTNREPHAGNLPFCPKRGSREWNRKPAMLYAWIAKKGSAKSGKGGS